MGKAIIKSNLGDGRYLVDIEFDTRKADIRKQTLTESIANLTTEQIPAAELEAQAEFDKLDEAFTTLNNYINTADPNSAQYLSEMSKLSEIAIRQKIEYDLKIKNLNRLNLQLQSQQKEFELLSREVKSLVEVTVWCKEFNDNLTGEIATIEADYLVQINGSNGAPVKTPILLPDSYSDQHGLLQTIHSSGPASTFFNLSIYPGMQKHKPRYRVGTITALNKTADTASVNMDVSTHDPDENSLTYVQDFDPVSFNNFLNHIPVEYMTCNAKAFEVGDRVVVGFGGEWENGKVIGFESNPKKCAIDFAVNFLATGRVDLTREQTYSYDGPYYNDFVCFTSLGQPKEADLQYSFRKTQQINSIGNREVIIDLIKDDVNYGALISNTSVIIADESIQLGNIQERNHTYTTTVEVYGFSESFMSTVKHYQNSGVESFIDYNNKFLKSVHYFSGILTFEYEERIRTNVSGYTKTDYKITYVGEERTVTQMSDPTFVSAPVGFGTVQGPSGVASCFGDSNDVPSEWPGGFWPISSSTYYPPSGTYTDYVENFALTNHTTNPFLVFI